MPPRIPDRSFTLDPPGCPLVLIGIDGGESSTSFLPRSASSPRLSPWRTRRNELIYILATPLPGASLGAGERTRVCGSVVPCAATGERARPRSCGCRVPGYPEGAASKVQGLHARCRCRELKPKHVQGQVLPLVYDTLRYLPRFSAGRPPPAPLNPQ